MTVNPEPPSLSEELASVSDAYPGWCCWLDPEGCAHADDEAGHQVDARTPELLGHEIAAEIHHLRQPEYQWGNPNVHPFGDAA